MASHTGNRSNLSTRGGPKDNPQNNVRIQMSRANIHKHGSKLDSGGCLENDKPELSELVSLKSLPGPENCKFDMSN